MKDHRHDVSACPTGNVEQLPAPSLEGMNDDGIELPIYLPKEMEASQQCASY